MRKFTILTVALLIATICFAQTKGQLTTNPFKKTGKIAASANTRDVTGTLQLSDTEIYTGIGTGGAGTFAAAARFEASALTPYVGQYITKINVFIADASVVTAGKVAILTGTTDAPVIATQQTCNFQDEMNEIILAVPYQIQASTPIMVAYEVTATGGYPLGCDAGPVVQGANLINMEGVSGAFYNLSDLSETLTFNFIISATVEDEINTDPILMVNQTQMVFIGYVGENATAAQQASVTAYNLIDNISIATAAPFEVSTNGATFGSSATMNGSGNFYIRYIPEDTESESAVTGTVTISSTDAESVTIDLIAITFDCTGSISELPYEEGFESGIPCWTMISNNAANEGDLGVIQISETNYAFMFSSYDEAETEDYNQYLITPKLAFTEDVILSFKYAGISQYSEGETFAVLASSTTNNISAFTTNLSGNIIATNLYSTRFLTYTVTIPAGTKYIAINYYSDYQYGLLIDDFELFAIPTTNEIALTSVLPATGTTVSEGHNINISGTITNHGVTLTSYKVAYSVDGDAAVESEVTGISIPLGSTHNFSFPDPISGLTIGTHTITVTVSEPNGGADGDESDNSQTITINIISCETVTTFPYIEDFESGINSCWTLIDADGDGFNWIAGSATDGIYTNGGDLTGEGHDSSRDMLVSGSYSKTAGVLHPDNWAISPAIALPAGQPALLSFYAAAQDMNYPAEHYGVYVSNTTTDPSAFTLIWEEDMDANGGHHRTQGSWSEKQADISNYAGQTIFIGFRHFNSTNNFLLIIDDVTISLTTATDENLTESIAIYPNPTNSMITVANAEGKDIVVVNSLGQVVVNIKNAAANQTIDVTDFANGTYFVKVDGEVVKLNVVK
ncbi:MAG: choice-of-anchor J domain-containing protein [Bacteroidales bacterium]|nr:choice-of-anchor J domain-containing protein [Bacteroidales bacterium]